MRTILALCVAIILLTACEEAPSPTPQASPPVPLSQGEGETSGIFNGSPLAISLVTPSPWERGTGGEATLFRLIHHYGENFNFTVHADSLVLLPAEGETGMDTAVVYEGDLLVVAQVKRITLADSPQSGGVGGGSPPNLSPTRGSWGLDSFAIKVARDQWTMGWIGESELLAGVVPDDTLSEFIYFTHPWLLPLLAVLAALLVWIAARLRLPRLYPTLLLICTLLLSALSAYIRHAVPEFWQEYYFHPTLNPLILPLPLALYVATAWLTVIIAVAVGIDWYGHHREPQEP